MLFVSLLLSNLGFERHLKLSDHSLRFHARPLDPAAVMTLFSIAMSIIPNFTISSSLQPIAV